MKADLKNKLLDLATAPYRPTGNFNYRWARGKLKHDPIFAALAAGSDIPDGSRILDLGCGRGLLAAWMLGAEQLYEQGQWTADNSPPLGLYFRGVELIEREAVCGNQALRPHYGERVRLTGGDMREADLGGTDVVAILDVLHYIPYTEQNLMLDKVRGGLNKGGLLITRVGNAGSGLRFRASQLVDACMSFAQGHRLPRMWCRPLSDWVAELEGRGFDVKTVPMSTGTPFANHMLIARVR